MRILKWLFQPAYLLFIIVLIALYVNRDAIFSDEVAESLEVEVLTEKVNGLAERLGQETGSDEDSASEVEVVASTDAPAVASETTTPVTVEVTIAEAQEVAEDTTPAPMEAPEVSEVQEPASPELEAAEDTTPASMEVAEVSEAQEAPSPEQQEEAGATEEVIEAETITAADTRVEEVQSPVQPDTPAMPVIEAQAAQSSMEAQSSTEELAQPTAETAQPLDVWRDARRAVWQGDLEGAVVHYRQLISLQPHNYDAYGEMGNVLLAQSDVAGAVEAYVAAARLIHKAGHLQMANRLGAIITRLDEEQGRALWAEFSQR